MTKDTDNLPRYSSDRHWDGVEITYAFRVWDDRVKELESELNTAKAERTKWRDALNNFVDQM